MYMGRAICSGQKYLNQTPHLVELGFCPFGIDKTLRWKTAMGLRTAKSQ
jgi:hypothetical protein